MRVTTQQHSDQLLRDILHSIAARPEAEPAVTLILETALRLSGAAGAAFRSAGAAPLALAVGSGVALDLRSDETLLKPTYDAAARQLIAPVRADGQFLGTLWLVVDSAPDWLEGEQALLAALLDGLAIVVTRARAQEDAERVSQALLASITDPLLVVDPDWRLRALNPAAAALFDAVPGRQLQDVLRSDDLIAFAEGRRELAEWISGDRAFVPRWQPVSETQAQGWVLTLRDITQFKKLNQSQHEFVRLVSHDLRSPLTSMRGFADMMGVVGELNERQTLFIEKVLNGVTQITALVDNIQDAGRFDPETGFYEMVRSQCDLAEIVAKIINNYLLPAEKGELTLSMSVDDDVPIINADLNMLQRAITNLVDNAIKYTPNGGKIDVLVSVRRGGVVISVRDTGLGIGLEDQQQLFKRGGRVQRKEHKRIKGSGLGLFIVRSVARRHGGDAWIESELGVGSTFSFNIPLKGANLVIPG